jgi:hypothetical protein
MTIVEQVAQREPPYGVYSLAWIELRGARDYYNPIWGVLNRELFLTMSYLWRDDRVLIDGQVQLDWEE